MAVGISIRNLFVLTLIGSFAYTVYPLPVNGVEQQRPKPNSNNVPSPLENPWAEPITSSENIFWKPKCNPTKAPRHRRSPKHVKDMLTIMIIKLNQTFQQIHKVYKEPMTKTPRYSWLPKNPGKKMREISKQESYSVFYTKLQEYAVILHILNKTGPPAAYDPSQFNFAERKTIINSIASFIKMMLCELQFTMKGKIEVTQVNEKKFHNVIPSNLNHTQLYVYDMVTFNAFKKFLQSWKKVIHRKNGRKNNAGKDGDDIKKGNKKKKNPLDKKKKNKGRNVNKLAKGPKAKNKKVPGKQMKKQPK